MLNHLKHVTSYDKRKAMLQNYEPFSFIGQDIYGSASQIVGPRKWNPLEIPKAWLRVHNLLWGHYLTKKTI